MSKQQSNSFPLFLIAVIAISACTAPPDNHQMPIALTDTSTRLPTLTSTQPPTETLADLPTDLALTQTDVPPSQTPTQTEESPTATSTLPSAPTQTPILSTSTPEQLPPTGVIELDGAELPAGFSLRKVIDVHRPIGLQFDPTGQRFLVSTQIGELRLYDFIDQGNNQFDYASAMSGFRMLHGMAFHPENGDLYISTAGKISILRDTDDDGLEDEIIPLVEDLPFGLHQNNVPKFGPDGMLYIGIGSTCDVCIEEDERSATIMRFDPITGQGEIVATGLRNPFDVAFHPETGDLFATDNGRDDLGDFDPAEELNHIVFGNDYGWPDCWNALEGIKCDGTTQAVGFYEAHSSVNNLLFYTGSSFPAEYQNDLFALNFGSFLVQLETGIQRTKLTPDGSGSYTTETEWFLKMPRGSFPIGMTLGPDGAIYFGDYINGGIWRVSYGG